MKLTIQQIVNSDAALKELREAKLPAASAMRVALVMNAIQAPVGVFQEAYNALLEETGAPRKDEPGKYDITNVEKYTQEVRDLFLQEVEIPCETKIKNLGSAELKPSTLLTLSWLIDIQEPV